ncbi:serine/threonine-protein kinase [Nannocystis sp.]|uniref:serine/threonine-protein kinase n=1 Tax=Nannocystis sp. TaxID=1962667 RepID=UPI002428B7A2|nr:serine/threonine-protein kinase [Nannocystis sp.]MBK7830343.1 protein kinase [Nannocystis sp.]MBK9752316.1 protein kinase [Nannocystis sp.]
MSEPETTSPGLGGPLARSLEAEAMRRRLGARMFGVPAEPLRIGRFRVQRSLGQGGMGVVYAAEDDTLGRVVALKVIRPDATEQRLAEHQRLLAEARALARLSHPNVIHIYEVGEHGDEIFIAMEYVPGHTLLRWLDAPRSEAEIVAHFIAAGRGLAAAHAAGLVHRDFKPSNVLVGEDGRVRIVDFGLARGPRPRPEPASVASQPSTTAVDIPPSPATEPSAGTPGYMSPEQALGRSCDARSDQFSFCVALHEALYGHRPFANDVLAALVDNRGVRPPPAGRRGRVSGWLRRVLVRGLAFASEARFASMEALLVALERGPIQRRRLLLASAAGLALAAGFVSVELGVGARELCPGTNQALLDTWSPERRDEVRRAYQATQPAELARPAWERLAGQIDRYAGEWAMASREACERTQLHGQQTGRSLFARRLCLEERRQELADLVELIDRRDLAVSGGALELIARLQPIDRCQRDANIDVQAIERREETAHRDLRRARALQLVGRAGEARQQIAGLRATARRLGDRELEAEVLLLRGTIEAREHRDHVAATQTLGDAAALVANRGPSPAAPAIWNELALLAADVTEDAKQARMWLKLAQGAAGDPPEPLLQAAQLETESYIELLAGRLDRVLQLRRRALELRERLQSRSHPEVARARMLVANALAEQGKPEQTRELLLSLLAEQREQLGPSHPSLLAIELSLAYAHIDLEDYARAESSLTQARAEAVRLYGASSVRVASLDVLLAQLDIDPDPAAKIHRLRGAIAVFTAERPPAYSERSYALQLLANLLHLTEQHEAALAVNRELLALHDAGARLDITSVLVNIGDYLCLLDRCAEAVVPYARLMALPGLERTPGGAALPLQGLGRAHLDAGQPRLALLYFEQALAILQRTPRPTLHMTEQTTRHIAECLRQLGEQPQRTRAMLAEAERLRVAIAGAADASAASPVSGAPA